MPAIRRFSKRGLMSLTLGSPSPSLLTFETTLATTLPGRNHFHDVEAQFVARASVSAIECFSPSVSSGSRSLRYALNRSQNLAMPEIDSPHRRISAMRERGRKQPECQFTSEKRRWMRPVAARELPLKRK